MKRVLLTIALSLGLLACSGGGTPATPQQGVFQAKSAYAAALTVAVAYKRLPTCSETVKLPCSDAKLVAQLQKADTAAVAALDAAEAAVRTPGSGQDVGASALTAANAALVAFTSITSTLKVQ